MIKKVSGIVFGVLVVLFFICTFMTNYGFSATLDKPRVSLTFYDGYDNLYSVVRPILNRYSIPATTYIVTDWVDSPGHITWSQIQYLYWNLGWEIGNHTRSHAHLTTLSDSQIQDQIIQAQNDFINHGIMNVVSLASPYGEFDYRTTQAVKEIGITTQRQAWTEDDAFNYPDNYDFDPLAINVVSVKKSTLFSQIKTRIDQAVNEKKWLVLVIHEVVNTPADDYQISSLTMQNIAYYIYTLKLTGKIEPVTISRGAGRVMYYQNLP